VRHLEVVEHGSINLGDEIQQVLASTIEFKLSERGQEGVFQG